MKKFKNYVWVIFVLAGNLAFGQIDLGIAGGLYLTKNKVKPGTGFNTKSRVEYGVGILFDAAVSKCFSIQAQPMYLRKGGDIEVSGFAEAVSVYANYIEIPVLAKYTFTSAKIKPFIMLGPSLGFLVSAKQKASFIPQAQQDIRKVSTSADFSIVSGGGVKWKTGKSVLYAELLYHLGIANLDNDPSPTDFTESIKSRGVSFMFGITFPVHKK